MSPAPVPTPPSFLEPGRRFTPEEITVWADRDSRSLEQALVEADVLVSCPHAGADIPGELAPYLAPEFTRRLQYDFTDVATAAIARRWAEIDPSIVCVINPHPRMVRDPNRARPDDLAASLTGALARVRAAGPFAKVDLTGVDAIRPVTFSFYPLLKVPDFSQGVAELVDAFVDAGSRGVDVYQATRVELIDRMASGVLDGRSAHPRLVALSFHDTMNTTTRRDGAVNVPRDPKDRLPAVVALSNRGDAQGNPRAVADPSDPVTMDPERLRLLAQGHRKGFEVADPDDVALNQPYLGSQEIISAGRRFAELAPRAAEVGATLDAVQAEFLRELLLGAADAALIAQPGSDWPEPDPAHVEQMARHCRDSWASYRQLLAGGA